MRLRAILLASALTASAAHADPLVLRATGGAVYDSNVFRLPSGVQPLAGGGRDDTILQAQAAVHYDNDFSRQNVVVDATVTRYDFQNHKDLSFTGVNAVGTWNWRFASRFYGNVGYDLQRRQSNFAEFRGFGRNIVTIRQPFAELRYKPGGTLFAYSNYRRVTAENSSAVLKVTDYSSDVYGAGAGYDLRNFGNVRFGYKRTDRHFPTDQVVIIGGVPTALRNDYVLNEAEANILFPFSIKTALAGRIAYTSRKVAAAPQRDFSGLTGRLALDYRPSPLWSFELAARRELSSEEDIQTNFATVKEVTGYVQYMPREYWTLRVDGALTRRTFQGFATVAPTIGRDDRTRAITLTSGYAWRLGSRLDFNLRREHRNSTINALDYDSTTAAATLTVAFGSKPVGR